VVVSSVLWSLCFRFCVSVLVLINYFTLSLHGALPIYRARSVSYPASPSLSWGEAVANVTLSPRSRSWRRISSELGEFAPNTTREDRKSTRLNSSHVKISYAVLCLKKKIEQSRYHDCYR